MLAGHSTGGLIAMMTATATQRLAGLLLISASDDAAEAVIRYKDGPARSELNRAATPCSPPLAGCTNQGMDLELLNHASSWSFAALAPHLTKLPILMVTCNDPYAPERPSSRKAPYRQDVFASTQATRTTIRDLRSPAGDRLTAESCCRAFAPGVK